MHSSDLDGVRLDLAFRGYRMDQVDAVLDRLRQELVSRDQEIDRLRAQEDHHGDL
ncbi:MAG: DivIVA domain-containing protein [Ornithinimicrobium sp.]